VSRGTDTNLIFRALIILGLVAFGFFLAASQGLISLVLDSDTSRISYVILGLYLVACGQWLWLAHALGNERKVFALLVAREEVDVESGTSLLAEFVRNLRQKRQQHGDEDASTLVTAFGDQLANRHAFGHFLSDLLLKLGLLGTVVGFIFMLLPVGEIDEFDPSLMRNLLAAMSSGMAVALYTTIAGLITSTLLKLQYHLLDASAADLATRLAVLVDVRLKNDAT
jgi:hypothetical protein